MLTMGQAAKEAGVGKTTLSRAIHSGRLSATRNEAGGFQIDPAELFRVFPPRSGPPAHRATGSGASGGEEAALKAEIEGLRAQLALMRERGDELRDERDGWRKVAEARLLAERQRRRGWLGWLKAG